MTHIGFSAGLDIVLNTKTKISFYMTRRYSPLFYLHGLDNDCLHLPQPCLQNESNSILAEIQDSALRTVFGKKLLNLNLILQPLNPKNDKRCPSYR
jgi:hypothetical protein